MSPKSQVSRTSSLSLSNHANSIHHLRATFNKLTSMSELSLQPFNPPSSDSASLVKRLAGPSVTKAGLAKDQTEINRIIAEVSKGSKFYENERRKDTELTERINKILRIKDDLLKKADIRRVQADADRLLAELESERDLSQLIVHVDMDAFYASVELLHNPDLAGKPFGVGKGLLCTASYEARKYGVRSGMAEFVAKKLCPELITVPLRFDWYSEMSTKVMDIFRQYDPNMIVAGCDEGYLNITSYCAAHNLSPDECVRQMRERVKEETCLTVSAGIAPNKMLAKICSDKNKPNGQFHLPFEKNAIKVFMKDLSIRKLPGVGRVNERLLESFGVKTCGDIYNHRAEIWLMDNCVGKMFLYKAYLGIASNVVQPYSREERKSIGAERTFNPLSNEQKILSKLKEVSEELEKDMEESGWAGKTITLKYKLDTYQVFTRAKSFNHWITKKEDLYRIGTELLKLELPLCIRLIGLRVTKLRDLRESSGQGIKRFFSSSAKDQTPTKRRRVGDLNQTSSTNATEIVDVDGEIVDDDAMPGFHEHETDQRDDGLEAVIDLTIAEHNRPSSEGTFASPVTSNNRTDSSTLDRSSNITRKKDPVVTASLKPNTLQCPVCGKELETDNHGLNTHIDFCLSKDVIKEATKERIVSDHATTPLLTWSKKITNPIQKGRRG